MPEEFHYHRRVEFCETDAAGIAHFSAYFQYMEQAEHAFLRHLGTSVHTQDDSGAISWPRVSASCDYTGPVRFEDVLDVCVRIERLGTKSITYSFDFSLHEIRVATGKLTAVCCRIKRDAPPTSMPIPDWLVKLLRPFENTPDDQSA
ncbi:MAG: acyl-CoA thioesterase [Planctomycetaceae bacterium]|nr:acyl-CoA thioesterase [Planctomycetales bacterium]MCB9920812.1 acyl-CoA thioesterase [Planctomycetaceae bacterium]